MRGDDPAGLGRGPLTRWLPVLGQAVPEPPDARPFEVRSGEGPGRFVMRVVFSLPRVTIPAALMAIVWQVGESAVPVVMGLAIDQALATGDAGRLLFWIGVLVVVYVALTSAARFTNRLNAYAVQLLQHRLRTTLSRRILHPVHGSAAAVPGDGGVVSTMTNDVSRVGNGVLTVTLLVSRIAAIGFIAASLLTMHWLLGAAVLVGAPVLVWLIGVLSRRLARDTREYQNLLAATIGRATDLVTGYRVIKGIRAETEASHRYVRASQDALAGAKHNAAVRGRLLVVSGATIGVFVAAVAGLAGWFAIDGQLSIGGLNATVGLAQALLPQVQAIANLSIPNLAAAHASAARILHTLNHANSVTEEQAHLGDLNPHADARAADAGPLEVVLPGGSIRVGPGELVGVCADDRTAARIADALLNPHIDGDGVQVRLGDRPARELPAAVYRSQVSVAPHRMTLFTGTIRDNLTTPTSTPARITAAVKAAACEDFAADLDVPVGENGNQLSGGQRQRVALARALATDIPVLVLHDPTTAVDSVTEQAIAARLRGIRAGRSTLLIASSHALLGSCDRIIDLHPAEGTRVDAVPDWTTATS